MKKINKVLLLLAIALVSVKAAAQDSRLYTFSTDTIGNINKDLNGNTIDFTHVASVFAASISNQNTAIQSLPFEVVLLGKVYGSFMIGSSGYIALGNTGRITEPFLFPNNAGNSFQLGSSNNYINQGVIAPFWDFQKVKSVKYTVTGTAPNRCFVVEWQSYLPSDATIAADAESRFQARIYESSGAIEYVYGQMKVAAGSSSSVTATVGISRSSALGNYSFLALADLDSFKVVNETDDYTTQVDALYNVSDTGIIEPLHYSNDSSCTRFVFTPVPMNSPSNLRVFNVKQDSALLYWDDNSSDEILFQLYKADRNGVFSLYETFTPNLTYLQLEALKPSTTYTFKVRGYNQGQFSSYSNTLSFTTPPPSLVEAKQSGKWSDTATWGGIIPSDFDSVVISNGYTVMLDVANGTCYNLVLDNGALLYRDSTLQNGLEVFDDLEIKANGVLRVPATPTYSNFLNYLQIHGNLLNNGVLKLYDTGNQINEVGARLTFYEIGYSEFYGNPTTNDIYELAIIRAGLTDSVIIHPSILTVKGSNSPAEGFLLTNTLAGVVKFSGNFKLQTELFKSGTTVSELGSIWMDNDSMEVTASNSDYTFNGGFRMSKGIFNAGTEPQNKITGSFSMQMDGGELNVAGSLYSDDVISFIQTGGIIRVALAGNPSGNPSFGISNSGAIVQMLGGTVLISQAGSNPSRVDYYVIGDKTLSDYDGGLVQFSGKGLGNTVQYFVGGNFPELHTDSSLSALGRTELTLLDESAVYGRLYLSINDAIDLYDQKLSLYHDSLFLEGDIMSFSGDGHLVVAGAQQSFYGAGAVDIAYFEVFLANSSAEFVIPNDSILHAQSLGLAQGKLVHSGYLNLGDSVNAISIEVGGWNDPLPGAVLDTFPTLHQGAAAIYVNYQNLSQSISTGFEIPASRLLNNLSLNTENSVRISGGKITVSESLALNNGILHTTDSNGIYLLADESADLSAGANAYVNGPLTRKIKSNLQGNANYTFPVGNTEKRQLILESVHTGNQAPVVTIASTFSAYNFSNGDGITSLDTNFGHWVISGDTNPQGLESFNLTVDYKLTDGFVRLAGGKANNTLRINPIAFDSIGTRLTNLSPLLRASNLALTATTPVLYVLPAENLGDTLFSGNYKIGFGRDFENLTELSRKLNSAYIAEDLTFSITEDYTTSTEEFPIFFDQLRYVNESKKIKIQLDSGVFGVLTSNENKTLSPEYGMIAFFGVDSLEIDGSGKDILGVPTGTREWTFRTDNNPSSAAVFRYENDARHIALRALNIHSNSVLISQGAVFLSGTRVDGLGNDHNLFVGCELRTYNTSYCYNGIFNNATNATNDSITIESCEFSNFRNAHIFGSTNTGLGWKITKNHFFHNLTALNTLLIRAINISAPATAGATEISYNYFGGSEKFAGGNQWIYSGSTASSFISLATRFDMPSVFKGNVVKNFYQSTVGTLVFRLISIDGGKWTFSGNAFGGTNSFTDAIAINSANLSSVIYTPTSTIVQAEFYDNEFAYIRHVTATSTTTRGLRIIEYLASNPAIIERNHFHHIEIQSRRLINMENGALVVIKISNTSDDNLIAQNEIHDLSNAYASLNSFYSAIGIEQGGGVIDGNEIYNIYYTANAYTVAGQIGGIQVSGTKSWLVSNNQIAIDNTPFPNAMVNITGIGVNTTSAQPTRVTNNTVRLNGQTRQSSSFAVSPVNNTINLHLKNNILVNNITLTPLAGYRSAALQAFATSANFVSDHNLLFSKDTNSVVYNQATATTLTFTAWKNASGKDQNSYSGFIPVFKGATDLLLTVDTLNWILNATGASTPEVKFDFEGDARHAGQPDIGADEFSAPILQMPVYVSGNDTLCSGNARTIIVSNPNSSGAIHWYANRSGGPATHIGDTLVTGLIHGDTILFVSAVDTLMRSYRLEIAVKVIPVVAPAINNLPVDSLCSGTTLTLLADSAAFNTIEWFEDESTLQPFHTGASLPVTLLHDTVFYIQNTFNNGMLSCQSARDSFSIKVSTLTASTQTLSSQTICEGGELVWTINGPDEFRLFSNLTDLIPYHTDTTFSSGTLVQNTTYYYEVFNGSCAGDRQTFSALVNPIPLVPSIDSLVMVCLGDDVQLTPIASGTINWYADDSITTAFTSGPLLLTNLQKDTIFYTSAAANNCESSRIKVEVKVLQVQKPTLVSAETPICTNISSRMTIFQNEPGVVEWFTDAQRMNKVGEGNDFTSNSLSANTTFYFSLNNGMCISEIDSVEIAVNSIASNPLVSPISPVCFGLVDTLTAGSTGVVQWFDDKSSPSIFTGNQFITPVLTGNKKYFVKAFIGNCESAFVEVNVLVQSLPQPPLTDSIPQVCRNQSATLSAQSNHLVEWYNSTFATTPLDTGAQFVTPNLNINTTYYVQAFDGLCRSAKRPVSVTTRNAPALPQVQNTEPFCWGDQISISASSPASVRWYSNDTTSIHFHAEDTLFVGQRFADTSFYVQSFDGVCFSNRIQYTVDVIEYLNGFSFTIPDSVLVGVNTPLEAQGAINNLYSWNFGNSANISSASSMGPHTINWSEVGTKTVRLIVSRRQGNVTCDTIITRNVVVYEPGNPASIKTSLEQADVRIFPNPTANDLNIEIDFVSPTGGQLILCDALGRTVWTNDFETSELLNTKIDVSTLVPGIYIFRIEAAGTRVAYKISVE